MKIFRLTAVIFFGGLLLTSCKKFLDVKPKGYIIAEKISDFEALLNDERITSPFGIRDMLVYPTDDVVDYALQPQGSTGVKGNLYFWHEYINTQDEVPEIWAGMYNNIANMNLIIEDVMDAPDGSEQKKKQLYAEALVNKAFSYYHLLSYFAPAYKKESAASDFGVPYITSTNVSQAQPARPSLQQSYEYMIRDIMEALPDLPEQNMNKTRPTKTIAHGMLTRIYMSMADYENALKYASITLESGGPILDYNDYADGGFPSAASSPEELWLRYAPNISFRYSADLLSRFETDNDLRFQIFATENDDGSFSFGGGQLPNVNRGITYAEIYLDKAECLARDGKVPEALDIINNTIRVNRFAPAVFEPLTAGTREEAINAVLAERRRELAFKGLRWSDMKRLDAEARMPDVQRLNKTGTVIATLKAGSTAYTFQIPLTVQAFNPGMQLNKR